ncbi:hypothetical protein GCM10023219_31130 [Stakelama sediminis]
MRDFRPVIVDGRAEHAACKRDFSGGKGTAGHGGGLWHRIAARERGLTINRIVTARSVATRQSGLIGIAMTIAVAVA